MSFSRRNFLKTATVLSALSLAEIDILAAKQHVHENKEKATPDNEAYWKNVRLLFPLSKDFAYMNNGTLGPSPYPVIDAVHKAMNEEDINGNYGGYEAVSARLAKFVGANEDEIALTHNVTEGINITCWGLPLQKGDEVILTNHEHIGNAAPWLTRRRVDGIVIKVFSPAPTAAETLQRIADCITPRTKVIAVPHVPCTQGQVFPIKEICSLARQKGIYSIIDGAHGPGMLLLDLHDIGCDTYATCAHKWMLGPKGTGFLYVRKGFQDTLQPRNLGGGSIEGDWNMNQMPLNSGTYAQSAHRFFGGTQSSGLYKGVGAAIDFIESIGMHNIHRRIKHLGGYLQQNLLALGDKVELLTPTEESSRCAVNGFRIKGVEYTKFYECCAQNKIRIRSVAENGLNSLRVSTHIYNNYEQIDRLCDLIRTA
jgi:selenocysteine lyase/cysteine desulfurase